MPDSIRALTRLSDEQTRQIRELRRAMEAEIQPIRDEVREMQGRLRDELELAEPNLARVDSIMAEIWTHQRALQRRSIDLMLEEREVLTPQQFRFFLRWMVPDVMTPTEYDRDDRRREGNRQDQQRREDPGRTSGSTSPPPPGAPPPPPGQGSRHPH